MANDVAYFFTRTEVSRARGNETKTLETKKPRQIRMVDQNGRSWNQTVVWLGQLEGLRVGELGKSSRQVRR